MSTVQRIFSSIGPILRRFAAQANQRAELILVLWFPPRAIYAEIPKQLSRSDRLINCRGRLDQPRLDVTTSGAGALFEIRTPAEAKPVRSRSKPGARPVPTGFAPALHRVCTGFGSYRDPAHLHPERAAFDRLPVEPPTRNVIYD